MTLRPGEVPGRAIAVFPFLKTTDPIQVGSFSFRSTDDTSDLEKADASNVREIADMLFLKDDLRIRSASYAMLPQLDLDKADPGVVPELERIQAIIAYCYSAPRHTFGDIFFHFEQASLAIFSPQPVTTFLVRPDHHVTPAGDLPPLEADEWHRVPGFEGRYNFRNPFWVARGSRLYPPVPHISLNDSQNLAWDLGRAFSEVPQQLLLTLIQEPLSENAKRTVTAIRWYNRANSYLADDSEAILSLAVGFEALLGLPRDAKTDRFIDAISLLLGRVPRLNSWAVQFYDARSDVAHEGRTDRLRLMPTVKKRSDEGPEYQSLISYGRQIFQLCVGSVLFGAHLARRSALPDKLITNQERLELICKTLNDKSLAPADRFTAIDDVIATVDEYRYVTETGLRIETMLGALQAAAKYLLECDTPLDPAVKAQLSDLAVAKESKDGYEILVALEAWHNAMPKGPVEPGVPEGIMRRLTEIVWHYTFMHYFWMKKDRQNKATGAGSLQQ